MNVFYGLDSILISDAATKFINSKKVDNNFAEPNIFYLDQETIKDQIIRIINEASTINIFNQQKVIIINDYYAVLKNNKLLANDLFQELKKFNNSIIIIKLLTNEIKLPNFEAFANCKLVKSYTKLELKKWVINKIAKYKLSLNELEIELIVNQYPNNLSIIDNEMRKLKHLSQELTLPIIKGGSNKYFATNIYRLIDALLLQKYSIFWKEYRNYWQKINFDTYSIFNLLIARLELIRNIKLLQLSKTNEPDILSKLEISTLQYKSLLKYNLSVNKINELLTLACDIDFKIKNGKTNKNIAIELFFLKI